MAHGKDKIEQLIKESKLVIISTDSAAPFQQNEQVTTDSIDLRISNYGYKIKEGIELINTLNPGGYGEYFTRIELPIQGYILFPNDIIFIPTLEKIKILMPYYGEIVGRSMYSRIGLSVHLTQSKFSGGMDSVMSLQLKNNTNTPIAIFPRQKLVQMLIHDVTQTGPYKGQFSVENEYKIPEVKATEYSLYNADEIASIKNTTISKLLQQAKAQILLVNKNVSVKRNLVRRACIFASYGLSGIGLTLIYSALFPNNPTAGINFVLLGQALVYGIVSMLLYVVAEDYQSQQQQ
jgi:deoxycytidine triphosphate deaminase